MPADAEVDTSAKSGSGKQLERGPAWSVHKFGGTCVANPERIKNVAQIILNDSSSKKVSHRADAGVKSLAARDSAVCYVRT